MLSVSNLPDSATFVDSGNGHGLFRFHPNFYQAGIETVTFNAIDMTYPPPLIDFENVVITIVDVNQPPKIDSIGPKTIQAGKKLSIRVVGRDLTDPDGGPLHMSATGLPANSAFHDSGGGVAGFIFTPDYSQVGVDTVTFFCTDEGTPPLFGYRRVEITVTAGANRPPVLDSECTPLIRMAVPRSFTPASHFRRMPLLWIQLTVRAVSSLPRVTSRRDCIRSPSTPVMDSLPIMSR
jgi:hypothetical protein